MPLNSQEAAEAVAMLEKAGRDLQWLLDASEQATAALIAAFQGLAGDTDGILSTAGSIVERVENESVSSVLPNVKSLGVAANEFVGAKLQAIGGILQTVQTEMGLLQQLSQVTEGQSKIALQIKVLNVHTKVEVAHLGEVGAGFEYLASELADFSAALAANTQELTNHTENRRKAIEKTKGVLSAELPHLRDELTRIDADLSNHLQALELGLSKLSMAPAEFKMSAQQIGDQVGGTIIAFQGHDITRQQLEHVRDALPLIEQMLCEQPQERSDAPDACAKAFAGIAIQTMQLKAIQSTIEEWTRQIGTCMDGILEISASSLVGIGPLVHEQKQGVTAQLLQIDALEQQSGRYSGRILATLEGISNLSQLVAEHLQKSEAARNRLRLLTFNSVIEASRLGSRADTICVIADRIAEVAAEWNGITDRSRGALEQILKISVDVKDAMGVFSASSAETLAEAQERTKAGLERLHGAADFAVAQGQRIEEVVEKMKQRGESIRSSRAALDSCFLRINEVLTAVDTVKNRLELSYPDIREAFDRGEVEQLFSGSYTTQAERAILHAAVYGEEMPVEQCSSGNDVELF